jgi:cytochrome c553
LIEETPTPTPSRNFGKRSVWIALALGYAIVITCIGCMMTSEQKNLHTERSLSGPALYKTYCLRCHGDQGQAKGAIPALTTSKLNLDQFAEKLKTGGKGMPTFKNALFDSDFLPLYQYIKTIGQ